MKNLCIADGGLYWEDDNGKEYAAEWEELTRAYEKADKYRRHDLRANPKDLPERYENVLLHTLKSGDVVAYLGKDEWYVDYDDEFAFCDEGSCYAVAWRYIDPFEEET